MIWQPWLRPPFSVCVLRCGRRGAGSNRHVPCGTDCFRDSGRRHLSAGLAFAARAGLEPAEPRVRTEGGTPSPTWHGVSGGARTRFLRGHVPVPRSLRLRTQSERPGSNRRPPPWQGGALTCCATFARLCAPSAGIEPALSWFVARRLLLWTTRARHISISLFSSQGANSWNRCRGQRKEPPWSVSRRAAPVLTCTSSGLGSAASQATAQVGVQARRQGEALAALRLLLVPH